MAKLSKQEINALASKAHREINQKLDEVKNKLLEEYIPSSTYKNIQTVLEDILYRNKEIDKLNKEIQVLYDKFFNLSKPIFEKKIYANIDSYEIIDALLKKVKENEIEIISYPSIDEIKEDIIIASINEEFNAEEFIDSLIKKFT